MSRTPTRRVAFSRRDALKLATVGGGVAVAGAVGVASMARGREEIIGGECRFCTMHCGFIATTRGGKIVDVQGDPKSSTRGFLCQHGKAIAEVVHGDARVLRPLKRTNDAFTPSHWENAYSDIGTRLLAIRDKYGPESLAVMTGWPFVRHPMIHLLHRFTRAFGSPNLATVASLCEASGRMGRTLVWGANYSPDLTKVKSLFVWGGNPPRTAPPWAFMVTNVQKHGGKLIVIDPVRTELAAGADRWIAVRPGTDAALALGMVRHILDRGLEAKSFIADNVTGVEALKSVAEPFTPERVAAITGCQISDVGWLAEVFAGQGPSGVYDGLGIEHHGHGVDTVRIISSLVALCGFADAQQLPDVRVDAGVLPAVLRVEQAEPVPPPPATRPLGADTHPLFCAVHQQAHTSGLFRAMLDDGPHPVRALVVFGNNPAVTSPDSAMVRRALEKLDLLVVVDPFLSETGELADWVLPAASFAEDRPVHWGKNAEHDRAVVAPQGDSLPDAAILMGIARACGLETYFPWQDLHAAFMSPRKAVVDPWIVEKMRPDFTPTASPRFMTASGKIELASTLLPRFGLPALPVAELPPEPTADAPLVLVTGPRQRAYINSQFHRIPSVKRLLPEACARLHPSTAVPLGVKAGDRVRVVSASGSATFLADVTEDVVPGAVVVPHGWGGEHNANLLTTSDGADPISGFPRFRSLRCRLERA